MKIIHTHYAKATINKTAVGIIFILMLVSYGCIFLPYFPYEGHLLGHDWTGGFPSILAGDYWFIQNGTFSIPWSLPFKCGGYPFYGNNSYFTLAQWLSFIIEPLLAVQFTMLFFASLGFWGFYLLMRTCFGSSREAAVLAGALFMFNGFFAYRTIIGHFFHADMLIPLIALFCINRNSLRPIQHGILIGLSFAYMVHAGNLQILPAIIISICGLLFMDAGMNGWRLRPWLLLGCGGLLGVALSLSKLVAMTSLLHQFPRTYYLLPGVEGPFHLFGLIIQLLFFNVPTDVLKHVVNMQWGLARHEWEFSVTPIPLLLIVAGFLQIPLKPLLEKLKSRTQSLWAWIGFALTLLLPATVNFYTPEWNALLKTLPYFDTASNVVRWFLVYIPLSIAAAILIFDRLFLDTPDQGSTKSRNCIIALGVIVFWNYQTDKGYYRTDSNYDANPITVAWQEAFRTKNPRPIDQVVLVNNLIGSGPNDAMMAGASPIICYEPTMGYRLEKFPVGSLHPGPVFEENGSINLKNPACYLYPEENQCKPGDHFSNKDIDKARNFVSYQAYPFSKSTKQLGADWINAIALLVSIGALIGSFILRLKPSKTK